MASGGAIAGDEVKMVTGNIDTLRQFWRPEPMAVPVTFSNVKIVWFAVTSTNRG